MDALLKEQITREALEDDTNRLFETDESFKFRTNMARNIHGLVFKIIKQRMFCIRYNKVFFFSENYQVA